MNAFSSIKRWRNRTRIRTQLSLVVSAAVAALCALLILYSYLTQRSANLRHEATAMGRVLELESRQLDAYVDELCAFSLQLRNDSAFMSVLSQSGDVGYAGQQTLENAFRTQFYSRGDIAWMELYLIRPRLRLRLDNPRRKVLSLDYAPPEALEGGDAFLSAPLYLSIRPSDEGFLQITRTIIDAPRKTPLAVVRFLADFSLPGRLLQRHGENDERLYLFDASGAAFTDAPDGDAVRAAVAQGRSDIELKGERMLLAACAPGDYGITLAAVKPVAVVNAALNRARNITVAIGLTALAVICLTLLSCIHALLKPLDALAERMGRVGQGEFRERTALEGSSEMIGLSGDVNRMADDISRLIESTYMASLNERTAQLAALEAQTNPHFLFNTLQAIATEAILAEDQKVYRMITTLAALLRYTIKGGNLIDLDTELKYVDKYLTLQKARFGERLQYAIDVDPALLGCSVPKLGLLALVENSIVHGMQGSVDAIRLTLECRDRGDMADIRVTDDGAGISEARLRQLRASMADETVVVMQNIGLGNLSSRLRLLYEGRARLEIESVAAPERRTTVCIRIPKEAAEDVHNADH